jgi:hypothetical protein
MSRRVPWGVVAAVFVVGITSVIGAEGSRLNPSGFTSGQVCGTCHQDIYAMWKESKHARAYENPIFAAAFRDVQRRGGEARRLCLRCHAPVAGVTGDVEAKQTVTREGVTCDFCHSVTGVAIRDADAPFVVETGSTKRGSRAVGSSPAHSVQPSILHKSSRLCGGCHEFRNSEGVATISTFSEWRASSYPAELRACQDCHFVPVPGRASTQTQKGGGSTARDHRLQRSEEQLREAVRLDLLRVTRNAGRLELAVAVRNVGSGHAVPTGHPSRRLLLKVEVRAAGNGSLLAEDTRTFQKQLLEGGGRILVRDSDIMLRAREVRDTRITPGQSRTETFAFSVPQGEAVRVRAAVEYLYRSHILDGNEWRVEVARKDSLVPAN